MNSRAEPQRRREKRKINKVKKDEIAISLCVVRSRLFEFFSAPLRLCANKLFWLENWSKWDGGKFR